jgi:DNA-binding NtrC family response regulator
MTTKILIVDDDPRMRKSLANLLHREGYVITEAPGGKEAADHLGSDVFDLVIADLKMEPLSGLDLLRLVKQMSPDVEVILITAFGTIEVAVEAMRQGAFDFITKPFQVEEILLRVRNALEKHRLKEEVNQLRTEVKSAFGFEGIVGVSEEMRQVLPRHGGKRNRQGTHCPGDPRGQPSAARPLCLGQLCGLARKPPGE